MHHHLVFGVDDGSESFEMSQAMIRRAAGEGVQAICCTSHCTPGHRPFPWEKYMGAMEKMSQFILQEGIQMTLTVGCEILYTEEAPQLARRGEIPTISGRNAVLVEFLPSVVFDRICQAARDFGNAGYQVVFAHVERYDCLRESWDRLDELKDLGALLQMNCSTVIRSHGLFGDRWAKKALRSGYIDIAASDSHNVSSRACNIKECREILVKDYGEDTAVRLLETNPGHIMGFA
ncbi:MAG: hypothetical protein IJ083_11775 [Clostridia bacterium]|nr:hypothetical protein [Clostridia bacterium]